MAWICNIYFGYLGGTLPERPVQQAILVCPLMLGEGILSMQGECCTGIWEDEARQLAWGLRLLSSGICSFLGEGFLTGEGLLGDRAFWAARAEVRLD